MHRPVQRKYATKAAHGPRGEQGENLPYSIAHGRPDEIYRQNLTGARRASRGNSSLLDIKAVKRKCAVKVVQDMRR